jgi:hypothetical protein
MCFLISFLMHGSEEIQFNGKQAALSLPGVGCGEESVTRLDTEKESLNYGSQQTPRVHKFRPSLAHDPHLFSNQTHDLVKPGFHILKLPNPSLSTHVFYLAISVVGNMCLADSLAAFPPSSFMSQVWPPTCRNLYSSISHAEVNATGSSRRAYPHFRVCC